MNGSRPAASVRRAVFVHALSTGLVALVVATVSAITAGVIAVEEARAEAATIAGTIAQAVAAPLRDISVEDPGTRESVLDEIRAFIDTGVVDRVKVWQVDGDEAVVLISDEPRNEGVRRPFDAELAARLDAGEVVVLDVPDDPEHRYEFGRSTLEVFIGFEDAGGRPMRLELYLPSTMPTTLARLLATTLPIAVLGPLVLGAATLPLALRLARRLGERDAERRDLLHMALAASDRERRRLALRLHDGVIQDLASVGLALDGLGREGAAPDGTYKDLLTRASTSLDAELADLRALLTDLAPPDLGGPLDAALHDLATNLETSRTRISADVRGSVDIPAETSALLYRVARELVRNAIEHGAPTHVQVDLHCKKNEAVLRVIDDGSGFDLDRPVLDGHLGLSLIRQAVIDSGGSFDLTTGPNGTSARVRFLASATSSCAPGSL